jgi:hypothetical protein
MLDKRGMRAKGLPENVRTKVLAVRLRDLWVPRPGRLTRRWRIGWRSGAELGLMSCLLVRNLLIKPPGRLAMPWMIGWRNSLAVWTNRALFGDTPYR